MDTLVFLMNNPHISETLKEYKTYYKVLVIDKNQKRTTHLQGIFDEIIIVTDILNKSQMEKVFMSILATRDIRAVYGTYELVVDMAGFIREKFSIPGINHHQSLMVRNKPLMKEVLSTGGIRTAEGKEIFSLVDLWLFMKKYKFPFIIKPVAGFATKKTYKVGRLSDFLNLRLVWEFFKSKELLAESYIEGEEYHCDSVVVDGQVRFVSVAKYLFNCIDTLYGQRPYGSITFPEHSDDSGAQYAIKQMNERTIRCLGIKNAVFHMESFIDSVGQPILGEIAARIGLCLM